MITISIDGVDETLRRLSKYQGVGMFVRPMNQSIKILEKEMKVYPPTLPGQKYVRTGKLQQSWVSPPLELGTDTVRGKVGTNREYAPWVQSRRFQARIHRGRWGTDMDAIEKHRDTIVRLFRQAIEKWGG